MENKSLLCSSFLHTEEERDGGGSARLSYERVHSSGRNLCERMSVKDASVSGSIGARVSVYLGCLGISLHAHTVRTKVWV